LRPYSDIAIGELSRQTGCNIETIRYYERIKLIPPARRHGGRYRRYEVDDVRRLRFIRRARELGFSLDEIRALLRLAASEDEPVRAQVRALAGAHVANIKAKIADLQAMERVLSEAICACDAGNPPRCPLIQVFSGDPP
jgi:MerR family mercuric resistance operon transcriptional regulator